jgi:hypothetical protein
MGLTTKQENFCRNISINGLSISEAYKQSYNCENMKIDSIYQLSCRLSKQVKITSRIKELSEAVASELVADVVWDRSKIINELSINVSLGRETKQLAASNQAIKLIGLSVGNIFEAETQQINVTAQILHGLSDTTLEALEALAVPDTEPQLINDTDAIEPVNYSVIEPD